MSDPEVKRLGALPSAVGTITRLASAQTAAAGIDVGPLLKKAGLTPQQIDDPTVRLNVRDQITFLNLAADALQDDLLGFHLAQPPDLREIGLLYYVSASSDTLAQALRRAARYSTIVNEGVCLKYVNDKDATIAFRYVGVSRHLDRHQMEFFATTVVRVCRKLTGQHVFPTRMRLDASPPRRSAPSSLNSSAAISSSAPRPTRSRSPHRPACCRSSARTPISTSS